MSSHSPLLPPPPPSSSTPSSSGGQPLIRSTTALALLPAVTLLLPLSAFVGCVLYAFFFNFKASTYTHCEVSNFAPSISSSISHKPQKYFWEFCLALHSAPRFLFGYLACARARQGSFGLARRLFPVALVSEWGENFCLLWLSVVSSTDNFFYHKTAFVGFGFLGLLHMVTLTYMNRYGRSIHQLSFYESKAVRLRLRCLRAYFASGCLMAFFYWRHNAYCEPYVYSFFCMAEYAVVLSNMAFHMCCYYELQGYEVVVRPGAPVAIEYPPLKSVATDRRSGERELLLHA